MLRFGIAAAADAICAHVAGLPSLERIFRGTTRCDGEEVIMGEEDANLVGEETKGEDAGNLVGEKALSFWSFEPCELPLSRRGGNVL